MNMILSINESFPDMRQFYVLKHLHKANIVEKLQDERKEVDYRDEQDIVFIS